MHPGSPPQPPPQPPAQPNSQVGATLPIIVGGLALLLIAGIIAGAMIISSSLDDGGGGLSVASSPSVSAAGDALPSGPPSGSASPSSTSTSTPSPEPSTSEDPLHDSCLIGTWQETSHDSDTTIDGVRMRLHSWGATQHFKANGTLTIDYGDANNARAKVNNRTYEMITSGILTYNWQTSRGQILYSNAKASGTVVYRQSGRETSRAPLSGSIDPERYTCNGDSLREFGPTWTIELRRVNTAPL